MLKAIQLGQQLTKKEMKEVKGGGTCCAHYSEAPGNSVWKCGLTKAVAMEQADAFAVENGEANWCCVSCSGQEGYPG